MTPLAQLCFFPLIVQAICYGLYLATFVQGARWLICDDEGWWRLRPKINWYMFTAFVLIFLLETANLVLSFLVFAAEAASRLVLFLQRSAITTSFAILISLIIDAVLIYRCWVVHAKSWRIICLPLILWLSFLSSSIILTYGYSVLMGSKNFGPALLAYGAEAYRLSIVIYSTNIATNIYATSAITYRILRVARQNRSSAHILNIGRIIAESGILYTITSTLALISTAINVGYKFEINLFHYVAGIINVSMAGIAFNLILIRVGQNRVSPRGIQSSSLGTMKDAVLSTDVTHGTE